MPEYLEYDYEQVIPGLKRKKKRDEKSKLPLPPQALAKGVPGVPQAKLPTTGYHEVIYPQGTLSPAGRSMLVGLPSSIEPEVEKRPVQVTDDILRGYEEARKLGYEGLPLNPRGQPVTPFDPDWFRYQDAQGNFKPGIQVWRPDDLYRGLHKTYFRTPGIPLYEQSLTGTIEDESELEMGSIPYRIYQDWRNQITTSAIRRGGRFANLAEYDQWFQGVMSKVQGVPVLGKNILMQDYFKMMPDKIKEEYARIVKIRQKEEERAWLKKQLKEEMPEDDYGVYYPSLEGPPVIVSRKEREMQEAMRKLQLENLEQQKVFRQQARQEEEEQRRMKKLSRDEEAYRRYYEASADEITASKSLGMLIQDIADRLPPNLQTQIDLDNLDKTLNNKDLMKEIFRATSANPKEEAGLRKAVAEYIRAKAIREQLGTSPEFRKIEERRQRRQFLLSRFTNVISMLDNLPTFEEKVKRIEEWAQRGVRGGAKKVVLPKSDTYHLVGITQGAGREPLFMAITPEQLNKLEEIYGEDSVEILSTISR